MRYIVREHNKTGGTEYTTADDAIDAAVNWQIATNVECDIYMRYDIQSATHGPIELLSMPHTMEARGIAKYHLQRQPNLFGPL